jgi:hypothetical protein
MPDPALIGIGGGTIGVQMHDLDIVQLVSQLDQRLQ